MIDDEMQMMGNQKKSRIDTAFHVLAAVAVDFIEICGYSFIGRHAYDVRAP